MCGLMYTGQPVAYLITWLVWARMDSVTVPLTSSSQGHKYRDRRVQVNGCTPVNPPEPNSGSRTLICTDYSCPYLSRYLSLPLPVSWGVGPFSFNAVRSSKAGRYEWRCLSY